MEEQYVRHTLENDRQERMPNSFSSCICHSVDGFIRRTSFTSPRNWLFKVSRRLSIFARHACAMREVVRAESARQVGYMKADPGAINVIPGRVEFPVELRDCDAAKIDRMWEHIQERFKQIHREENVETQVAPLWTMSLPSTASSCGSRVDEGVHATGVCCAEQPGRNDRWFLCFAGCRRENGESCGLI